ncbi:hypothetical protein [Amycolatopsis albispora]|uniref:Uncharacterized protein n=1 Tax=Amycolatopsis albispora TaxID=1804986 RepID=A0A344L7Y9_9PSEU|nr:hypothetical protein [Amycolatopsis albispora]AXB44163.1 hypothetical protein A4R43_17875 [Amycolatopsis albispora]
MSWQDYYRRRDAIEAVLRHVKRDPAGPLPRTGVFDSDRELILALQYKWSLILGGHLRVQLCETDGDQLDAVTRAWRAAAAAQPTLRAVLDAHLGRFPEAAPVREAELRMLARAAGLAESDDSAEQVTKVGLALESLLLGVPEKARANCPVRRLLMPSA